jgi:2-keto-3-deoxy-L-rhamnonate aldolase RhmA
MREVRNAVRDRLAAGELAIGVGLRQARGVDVGKIMRTCGFDWLFIDMEHSSMSVDDAVQISVAAQDAGIAPFVRVPGFEHHHATRVLDGGALGVVFPHVDTPEQARQLVDHCRYPPAGHRSIAGALPQLDFEAVPAGEATAALNAATMIVIMLETPRAIANAEEIAAVPGVDALLVGTNDLCLEMGIPGRIDDERVVAAFETVIAACRAQGKHPALGGVYVPDLMERYIAMGMRMVLAGSDLSLMMAAARERTAHLRGLALA